MTSLAIEAAPGRGRLIAYWAITALVVADCLIGGTMDVLHLDPFYSTLRNLGYPAYFSTILGVGKLLAAIVLVIPRLPRLKEWAYAGIAITYAGIAINMTAAAASHLATHDHAGELATPLMFLALAMTSWGLRPPARRDLMHD
jgi:uncharacterized membrane protein YphA (DoxX/SURF4 family)